jgi:hypothetical protein
MNNMSTFEPVDPEIRRASFAGPIRVLTHQQLISGKCGLVAADSRRKGALPIDPEREEGWHE